MPRALPVLLTTLAASLAPAPAAWAADRWTDPHPGIRQLVRTASGPRRIYALEIDLCHRGIALRATKSGERGRTVSSFAGLVDADAAINGDFFSYSDYSTTGLAIGGGQRWDDTQDGAGTGFIAFGRGRAEVSPPGPVVEPPPAWMRDVVSGKRPLVRDGEAMDSDGSDLCDTRHPRTAAGLSRDRRTLILAVVDGRSSQSIGMTCPELGNLMVDLGAWDASNLDGGGSSTMWVRGSGVLNDPSDGSQRVVGNHLAVLAGGSADPGSCDRSWEEAAVHGDAYDTSTTTDVDGDGVADLCARAGAGIRCALSEGGTFATTLEGPALTNDSGWDDPTNFATLRMGDVDGDGRADLCARANAGIRCWLSDGAGFGAAIEGPALSDDSGWSAPQYYGTLRLADVTGDGKDDLCARAAAGFRCWPSNGAGFDAEIVLEGMANADGWDAPSRYGTIRMGDVDGDGKADVCGRAASGMRCWRSTGDGFSAPIDGPAWSNDAGWAGLPYWSTIRLADLDGDGKADLCARAAAGLACHLSTGDGFGAAVAGPAWSDEHGWDDYSNFASLRLADLDGDGALDACARANAGIRCVLFRDGGYGGAALEGPALSDDSGWSAIRFQSTIRFADVTADGKADLCARAAAGMMCWPFDGTAFAQTALTGPAWSDDSGWGAVPHYESIRLAAPRTRCRQAEECNGVDDTCDGAIDEGCPDLEGGEPTGAGGRDAGPEADGGGFAKYGGGDAGCSCRAAGSTRRGSGAAVWIGAVVVCGAVLRRRR